MWLVENGKCEAEIEAASGPVNLCRFVLLPPPPAALAIGRGGPATQPATSMAQSPPPAMLLTCHIQQQRQEGRIMLWDVVQVRLASTQSSDCSTDLHSSRACLAEVERG